MKKLSAAQQRFLDQAVLIAAMELVFSKLEKSGFPIYPLGEIAKTTSGGTPDRRTISYYGGNISWIKSGELNDGLIETSEEYLTEEGLQNSSAKIYPKGTLVVALYGATVGKTGILAIDAASNQAVCAIMPKTNRVSRGYLFWFLRYKRPTFLKHSFGGAQPNISQKVLKETNLPVPDVELQKKIMQFLEVIERRQQTEMKLTVPDLPPPLSGINHTVARIEELASKVEEARGLRRETVEEIEMIRASASKEFFVAEKHPNWPTVALGDATEIRSGVTLGRMLNGSTVRLPYLRVANVQDGYLNLQIIKEIDVLESEAGKWLLQPGDVLLTEGGDWDKLGRGTVWRGEIPKCIHQNHIFRVRAKSNEFDPDFLATLISSPYGKSYFQAASKQTTNLASINRRQLNDFKIFRPPLSEQRRIVAYLDDLQARVDAIKQLQAETGAELDGLLPSILDKAFRGELV